MSDPNPAWTPVGEAAGLPAVHTFKQGRHQLCVVKTDDGVFAIDNRCPHEGYPLATGDVRGCELTCAWHNWKFDLKSGGCRLGGEGVRTYPVRERDGVLEVDLQDPDPETVIPPLLESLEEGLLKHDNPRVLRDAVRLLLAGRPAPDVLADLARFDARRAEYGTTHVLPVAADCGRVLERYPGPDALYTLAPPIDLCGENHSRRPVRPLAEPLPDGTLEVVRHAVESEDVARAEGLLRGLLERPGSWREAETWLLDATSRHFLGFGHQLIYTIKVRELLERASDSDAVARDVLPALLYSILVGTREDTLPYLTAYFDHLEQVAPRFPELWRAADTSTTYDPGVVRDAVLDGRCGEALDALEGALSEGVAPRQIASAIISAAAQRLYRFDLAHETDPDVAENWLWATHRFTFASAVRVAIERWDSPDALRFLWQAVAFVHSGQPMDAPGAREQPLPAPVPAGHVDADAILAAITTKSPERAVALVRGWLADGRPLTPLKHALEDAALADPAVRPIVVAHVIKTLWAAFDEFDALEGHPDRDWPLLAAVRFVASPVKERRVHDAARTSIAWVAENRMPRKLTQ